MKSYISIIVLAVLVAVAFYINTNGARSDLKTLQEELEYSNSKLPQDQGMLIFEKVILQNETVTWVHTVKAPMNDEFKNQIRNNLENTKIQLRKTVPQIERLNYKAVFSFQHKDEVFKLQIF